jgi:hypothetical protein
MHGMENFKIVQNSLSQLSFHLHILSWLWMSGAVPIRQNASLHTLRQPLPLLVWAKISSLAGIALLHSAVRTCCKYQLHKHEFVAILSEGQMPCLASELLAKSVRCGLCTVVRRHWYFAPLCYVLRDCCNWTAALQQSESFRPSFGSRLHTSPRMFQAIFWVKTAHFTKKVSSHLLGQDCTLHQKRFRPSFGSRLHTSPRNFQAIFWVKTAHFTKKDSGRLLGQDCTLHQESFRPSFGSRLHTSPRKIQAIFWVKTAHFTKKFSGHLSWSRLHTSPRKF